MTAVDTVDKQIIEVAYSGEVAYDTWIEYQQLMLDKLNKVDHKLYILTNFTEVTQFDPKLPEKLAQPNI